MSFIIKCIFCRRQSLRPVAEMPVRLIENMMYLFAEKVGLYGKLYVFERQIL